MTECFRCCYTFFWCFPNCQANCQISLGWVFCCDLSWLASSWCSCDELFEHSLNASEAEELVDYRLSRCLRPKKVRFSQVPSFRWHEKTIYKIGMKWDETSVSQCQGQSASNGSILKLSHDCHQNKLRWVSKSLRQDWLDDAGWMQDMKGNAIGTMNQIYYIYR